MQIRTLWHAGSVLFLVLIASCAWRAAAGPVQEGFATKVEVTPGKLPNSFRFKARVTQLATGKPIAGADLTVKPGEPAKADSVDPDSGVAVLFTARADKPASIAYSFVIRKDNVIVSQQEGILNQVVGFSK